MTESVSRLLYRHFLLLYPERFRHEFGDEMLAIFEQCRAAQGFWRLFTDLVLSAAKQQIDYLLTPAPKGVPLYSEIASSSDFVRMFAVAVCAAALIAGILVGRKPEDLQSETVVLPEALFWFRTGEWKQYRSDGPERTGKPESVRIAGVLVARKREAPNSYRVVRSETQLYFPTASSGNTVPAQLGAVPQQ